MHNVSENTDVIDNVKELIFDAIKQNSPCIFCNLIYSLNTFLRNFQIKKRK